METTTNSCAECEWLQAQLNALRAEITALRAQLAAARKTSSTSSKPLSSDIVKPTPAPNADGSKRSIGGQPGHPKHDRVPFPPEQVTLFTVHTLEVFPCCGGPLHRNAHQAKVVQQVDIQKPLLIVEQHTSLEYWCDRCQSRRSRRKVAWARRITQSPQMVMC